MLRLNLYSFCILGGTIKLMDIKKRIGLFNVRKFVLAVADMFIIGVSALLANYFLTLTDKPPIQPSIITMQTFLAVVVGFRYQKDLCLVHQPSERAGMYYPVAVALKVRPNITGLLVYVSAL